MSGQELERTATTNIANPTEASTTKPPTAMEDASLKKAGALTPTRRSSASNSARPSPGRGNHPKLYGVRLEIITKDESLSKTDVVEGIMTVLKAMKNVDRSMVVYNHRKDPDSRKASLKDFQYVKGDDESCADLKEYFDMQFLPWTGRSGTQKKFFSSFAVEGSRQFITWCQTRGNSSFSFAGRTMNERIFLIAPHTFTRSHVLTVGYLLYQDPRSGVNWSVHRERLYHYLKFQLKQHPMDDITTVPKFFTRGGVKVPFQETSVELFCIETVGGEPFDNLHTLLEEFCTPSAKGCPFTVVLQNHRKKNPQSFEEKLQQHNDRIADMVRIPIGGVDPEINNRYRLEDDKKTVTSMAQELRTFTPANGKKHSNGSNNSSNHSDDQQHPIYDFEGPLYFDPNKGGKFYVVAKRSAEEAVLQWLNDNLASIYAKYNTNGTTYPACPNGPVLLADTRRRSSMDDSSANQNNISISGEDEHVMNGGSELTMEELKAENAQLRRRNRQLEDRNAELNRKQAQLRREMAALIQQMNKLDNLLH